MLVSEVGAALSLLWQVVWMIPIGFVLYITLSYVLVDFAYPIAENPRGTLNLFLTYLLSGFIFSFLSILGDPGVQLVRSLIVVGVTSVGLLRLYALRRSFLFPNTADTHPFEQFIVAGVAVSLSALIVVRQVLPLPSMVTELLRPLEQERASQSLSLFLVSSSLFALVCVEVIWGMWVRLPFSRERAYRAVEQAIARLVSYDLSGASLKLLRQIVACPEPRELADLAEAAGIDDKHELQMGVQFLLREGQILQFGERGIRRHPHLFQYQSGLVARLPRMLGQDRRAEVVERALEDYGDADSLRLNPLAKLGALKKYRSERGVIEQPALKMLMDATFDELQGDTGEFGSVSHVIYTYLDLRYREGWFVTKIADKLGYSREHLHRKYHSQAIEKFAQVLRRKISELGGYYSA